MKNYSFDNIIKEKAAAHEAPVPADAWNNIKKQKKKKRYGVFWWTFGIVFLIGIGIFGIYQNGQQEKISLADKKTAAGKNLTNSGPKDENIKTIQSKDIPAIISNSSDSALNDLASSKKVIVNGPANNDLGKNDISAIINNSSVPKEKLNILKLKQRSRTGNGVTKKIVEEEDIDISDETTNSTSAISSIQKEKPQKELSKLRKNSKQIKSKTAIVIEAPGMDEENNTTKVLTSKEEERGGDVAVNTTAENKNDSIQIEPEIKKQMLATDTNKVFAKQNEPKKKKQRSLFIEVSTTPFLAIQKNASLSSISRTTVTPAVRSEFFADEIATTINPSFSYGLALRKGINKKLQLGIGVQYTKLKETVRLSGKETNTNYSVIKRLDNSGSFLVNDTVATITQGLRIINATNSYDIISMPVFVQYNLFEKRSWALSLSGGLNFNISNIYKNSIKGHLVSQYASRSIANKKEHTVTTDLFAAIRLSRTMGNKFKLYAEPTLQFNLMRYNMRNMINYKNIHRAGLTIGISYQLKF